MPSFLSNRVGPLPTWGWITAGLGVYAFVRWRRAQAAASANVLPLQSLNPDYGPTGWPGQGSLGPPPISAVSQVAGTGPPPPSGSSAANAPLVGGRTTLQQFDPTQANSSGSPPAFYPRVL